MVGSARPFVLTLVAVLALAGCAKDGQSGRKPLPPGAQYVAMGSSFAAGPGVTSSADNPPNRCGRSMDNYARILARRRGLSLVDVTCSGATTAHILGPWEELPPQIEAVSAETRLVTVTIGGNDLRYIGRLMAASCEQVANQSPEAAANPSCRAMPAPAPEAFTKAEAGMREIAEQVRQRAPQAKLIFVDYLTVLPPDGTCSVTPLAEAQANLGRAVAQQLAALTAQVAKESRAGLVQASRLSADHHACAKEPWMEGYVPAGGGAGPAPYHPNLAGMTAVADALDKLLGR